MDDHELASALATEAGEMLVKLRERYASASVEERKAAGDQGAQELLSNRLAAARPRDVVLSEEAPDDPARLSADRVWIIDPLDGTREFGEPGRADWAVHVALWQGGELVAGAVALPASGITLGTPSVPEPPERPAGTPIRLVVSRSRRPPIALEVARRLGGVVRELGSAGAKAMAVVTGEVDAYLHMGGQYQWDSAAPVAVARAAGLHASRLNGNPLRYNEPDLRLPDLLICRPEYAAPILAITG